MKELSLNILDIAENSVKARASLVSILIDEKAAHPEESDPFLRDVVLTISILDDGCGMTEEILRHVTDPFYTTRKTRSVGLGLPFFKMEAEMTGGYMEVRS
ncbi:MAG: ATP-binding protein, partial [Lachnospiraceae bacterium]|nr:ATP-binding protein [Lachnospiraceae bacterium]